MDSFQRILVFRQIFVCYCIIKIVSKEFLAEESEMLSQRQEPISKDESQKAEYVEDL